MKKILLASVVSAAFAVPAAAADRADVVVIGAGGAGLSAAVTAHDLGKKVIVLEKMAFVGGNTNRAAGGLNAAETKPQEKAGIKDSIETHFNDTMKGGKYLNNPDLVHVLTDNARYSVDFINSLKEGDLTDVGMLAGATNKRAHRPAGGGFVGANVVKALATAAKDKGIDVRTNAKAEKLIVKNGQVVGVQYKDKNGVKTIDAKAVVLASGGFGANQELLTKINPKLKGFGTTNHPGATGDVLTDLVDIGAGTRGLDYIQCIPGGVPGEKYPPNLFTHVDRFLFINLNGQRFIKEDARRDVLRDAMLDQPKAIAWTLVDADGFEQQKNSKGPENEAALKAGTLYYADTIEDLAKKTGLPAKELKEAVDTYNKAVDTKKDPFGRAETVLVNKIIKAPFYAGRVTMKRHHTMGGVIINKDAQVIDRHGNVIPGLYAAGEVTGGIHGTNRVGGNAMADIFTYGRIAGVNAAKNPA